MSNADDSMEVRVLTNEDHEVLGLEYCSGYTDQYGKWNTGFYCPNLGTGETVYCCGTKVSKYCCTKRDESQPVADQKILLGIAVGVVFVVLVIGGAICYFCRRCSAYKNRHHTSTNGGPLYQLHCSSTISGVANMYSQSNPNSTATTPIDGVEPRLFTDLANRHLPSHGVRSLPPFADAPIEAGGHCIRGLCSYNFAHLNEPPPPYTSESPHVHIIANSTNSYSAVSSPSISSFTQAMARPSCSTTTTTTANNQRSNEFGNEEEPVRVYRSTKF